MITSSAATTTASLATGISVAGATVAVTLFVAILARECVLSDAPGLRRNRAINAILAPLAIAFLSNLVIQALMATG
jgi:hypothetical protein